MPRRETVPPANWRSDRCTRAAIFVVCCSLRSACRRTRRAWLCASAKGRLVLELWEEWAAEDAMVSRASPSHALNDEYADCCVGANMKYGGSLRFGSSLLACWVPLVVCLRSADERGSFG